MDEYEFEILQPKNLPAPRGYSNGIVAMGRQVFIAGQIGWNEHAKLVSDDFVDQVEQALANIVRILAEAGGKPGHLTRLTWFLTDKSEYIARQKEVGLVYRRLLGRHFPAMTAVVVTELIEDGAKVEIEATAVVPSKLIFKARQ